MAKKRITIYDIASELGITASYVSKALNNYPSVNPQIVDLVKKKAAELNYKHNSSAANLRQGVSKTIGVIVPQINQSFFSEAIAGMEEVCFQHGHSLIICQSQESFQQETLAIETLIRQNVDCIFISTAAETTSTAHLEEITNHHISLIQFDRYMDNLESYKVTNDNKDATYMAVKDLIRRGYQRIAFVGGPVHISIFRDRKAGYLKAIKESGLGIDPDLITDNQLGKETAMAVSRKMLGLSRPPDAFFAVSDHQSLGILETARSMGIAVPKELGIIGFANESFTGMVSPSLSSIDQHSKNLGRATAELYFKTVLAGDKARQTTDKIIIKSKLIIRESSSR